MTKRCVPPLAGPCDWPAAEAVRIRAAFLPPSDAAVPLCAVHVGLWTGTGIDLEVLTGDERDAALGIVRPHPLAFPPGFEDAAPGELAEAFGR